MYWFQYIQKVLFEPVYASNEKLIFQDLAPLTLVECDLVGVMHEPVEDGIGEGGIADGVMPLGHRQLAGDHGRPGVVAIVQQLEQVAPRAFGEWGDPQQLPANYLYGALTCGVVGVPARLSSDGERYFARTAIGG